MAVTLAVGAAFFSVAGADSVVSSVRAAAPYEFSNPSGGTVTDNAITFASPSPLVTVTNTSGVRIRIATNGNPSDTGTCAVGSQLALGASCTTQAVCPVPVVAEAPTTVCPNLPGTAISEFSNYLSSPDSSSGRWFIYAPTIQTEPTFNPAISGITTAIINVVPVGPEYGDDGLV